MTRRVISTGSRFEAQIGYARAVVDGGLVYISGTTGFDYETMTLSDDVVEQAEQCFKTIGTILMEAGSSFEQIVRIRYMLPDREDFEPCWPVFKRYLDQVRPAATMLVAQLYDPRMKIEVEVTARVGH